MTIIALDQFVITVTDLNKSKNFYHEILGLPIVDEQLETRVFDFCLQTDQPIKNVIAKYKSNNQEIISGPVEKHGAHGKMTSAILGIQMGTWSKSVLMNDYYIASTKH